MDIAPDRMPVIWTGARTKQFMFLVYRRLEEELRSFAPDKVPVIGYDTAVPGFFWLAGQGGYGMQTAPAAGRIAAALAMDLPVPEELLAHGLDPNCLAPSRFER